MDQTRPRAGLETRCPAFGVYASCPKLFLGRLVGPYAFVYGSCPCRQNQRQMFTGQHRYSKYADKGHIDPWRITNNVKGHWGDTTVTHVWGMGKLRGWSVGEGNDVGGPQRSDRSSHKSKGHQSFLTQTPWYYY
ncbi:hypothetical protein DPX16_22913 [Anabarilius grahami]|uniref:Uncharacterized protein n=1 Tax=Anabarilius grahami TaxID=495550 RepID=A0A3N0YGK1_ANAGA|nr:hypothetical protein DPX16_22913 [Anabarilius grahami]